MFFLEGDHDPHDPLGTVLECNQDHPKDENQGGGVNSMINADYNFFTQCM
jgi:hypothetical protein